jgi:hypothetical protein
MTNEYQPGVNGLSRQDIETAKAERDRGIAEYNAARAAERNLIEQEQRAHDLLARAKRRSAHNAEGMGE